MKYIFVVQGEGRGHLTQAISLSAILREAGHEVVEVLVGKCSNRELPTFFFEKIGAPVARFNSPSINYGKNGKQGKMLKTIVLNNTPTKIAKWIKSIDFIVSRFEKSGAEVVVNFYEMLVGVASVIRRFDLPVVNIAHQFLIDHPDYRYRPKSDQALFLLRAYNIICSLGSTKTLALSLYNMRDYYKDRIAVVPPLLRNDIFELEPSTEDYILGYMLNPAFIDEVIDWKERNVETKIHLFWDKKDAPEQWEIRKNLWLHRINDKKFLSYMEKCKGYVTTAGFESVCEAMYLGKPVMMIPSHIEQSINATDANGAGAGITCQSFNISKLEDYIPHHTTNNLPFREWVDSAPEQFLRHLTTLV